MNNVINWFEIPAEDIDRAIGFYEKVFLTELRQQDSGGNRIGIFPYEGPGPSGAVCQRHRLEPATDCTMIYLDAGDDVATVLERVEGNGGRILLDKTLVAKEIGHIGIFIDSEGNRIGVHSRP